MGGGASVNIDTNNFVCHHHHIWLSNVVVKRPRSVLGWRRWKTSDLVYFGVVLSMHLLSLFAPFYFSWSAVCVALALYFITGIFGICLSYHRNLSHRSFELPKWLEYSFAYCGVLALQCGVAIKFKAMDLQKQSFYRFLQRTYGAHIIALGLFLYALGGFSFIVWGMGVRTIWVYHITWLVNSACHVWGTQAWNTGDFSKNNWYLQRMTTFYWVRNKNSDPGNFESERWYLWWMKLWIIVTLNTVPSRYRLKRELLLRILEDAAEAASSSFCKDSSTYMALVSLRFQEFRDTVLKLKPNLLSPIYWKKH